MEIHVSNRRAVEQLVSSLDGDIAVISVIDPDEPTVCDNHNNILRLEFHDLDYIWPHLNEVTYFDNEMADSIMRFVNRNQKADHIVVHCEAGISRSSAIAAAISEFMNIRHKFFRTHMPNMMVYSLLRVALGFIRRDT